MFLEKFFYPRLVWTQITWIEVLYALAGLVAVVWLAVWWNHKRTGRWGWGLSRWAVALWLVTVVALVVFQFSEMLLFPGRFVSGLKMEGNYITTYTATPDPSLTLETKQEGFRLTVFHVDHVYGDDGKGHKVLIAKGLDYVRHVWVTPGEYLYLVGWLRSQKLPLPHPYDPRILYGS